MSLLQLARYFNLFSLNSVTAVALYSTIRLELHIAKHTATDWTMFCQEAIWITSPVRRKNSAVLVRPSRLMKAGGENAIATDWVFGGVERQSGRTFLVPVPDRIADTSTNTIHTWIEPGTTIISDCLVRYVRLRDEGCTHHTVNHTVGFVDGRTGAHTNTIEGTGKHVKVILNAHNRQTNYIYYLSEYMFAYLCRARAIDPFTMFLHVVAHTDSSLLPAHASPHSPPRQTPK
jgi:hypothetical protein